MSHKSLLAAAVAAMLVLAAPVLAAPLQTGGTTATSADSHAPAQNMSAPAGSGYGAVGEGWG